jgi:hypothetical protein
VFEYWPERVLGKGTFATVFLGRRIFQPADIVAVKVIDVDKVE